MKLAQIKMVYKYKIHPQLWRLSKKKMKVKYVFNNIYIEYIEIICWI